MTEVPLKAGEIVARMDRIPIWALSYIFIGILGMGFLFTFYDIFDINVSFIQTAITTFHVTSPSSPQIGLLLAPAVLANLAAYIVGAILLSPLSDKTGRRNMLVITMAITGLGSLYSALSNDYINFILSRVITGVGVGADLAIVNTYINEVAPPNGRAKYTSLVFLFSGIGATLGVWLGLLLTTPASPFPLGLPFALGGSGFFALNGWRLMYGIGALLALVGLALRLSLPESPRWLLSKGRINDAEAVVAEMENRASKKLKSLPPLPAIIQTPVLERQSYVESLKTVLGQRKYLSRLLMLVFMWFFGYMTVYITGAALTSVLSGLGYPPPEAGIIVAVGVLGFILSALTIIVVGDRLERKTWNIVAVIFTVIGALVMALARTDLPVSFLGSLMLFYGANLFVPTSYAWTAESFPTRARATGFALADGVGHIGGGIGVALVASFISALVSGGVSTTLIVEVMLLIAGFQVISAIIAIVIGHKTANRRLDEISP